MNKPRGRAGFRYYVRRGLRNEWDVMRRDVQLPSGFGGEWVHATNSEYNALRVARRLNREAEDARRTA